MISIVTDGPQCRVSPARSGLRSAAEGRAPAPLSANAAIACAAPATTSHRPQARRAPAVPAAGTGRGRSRLQPSEHDIREHMWAHAASQRSQGPRGRAKTESDRPIQNACRWRDQRGGDGGDRQVVQSRRQELRPFVLDQAPTAVRAFRLWPAVFNGRRRCRLALSEPALAGRVAKEPAAPRFQQLLPCFVLRRWPWRSCTPSGRTR